MDILDKIDEEPMKLTEPAIKTAFGKIKHEGPNRILRRHRNRLILTGDTERMNICFIRDDGWSLGAIPETEAAAFESNRERWFAFVMMDEMKLRSIVEYTP